MTRFTSLAVVTVLALASTGPSAKGDLTIDTTIGWNGIDGYGSFGLDGARTMGQTFNSGSNNVLQDFAFNISQESGYSSVSYEFYVMAWNGQEATGPVLFQSGLLSTAGLPTYTATPGCFTEVTINTQDLSLTSNTEYVAFLSTVGLAQDSSSRSIIGARYNNPYQGGGLFFSVQPNDFSLTRAWVNAGDEYDFAFRADLLSVPEPNSIIIVLSVTIIVSAYRTLRHGSLYHRQGLD